MIFAGILAGGMGERIGNTTPKQFLNISGKPIIYWPLKQFYEIRHINKIIISTRKTHIDSLNAAIAEYFTDVDRFSVIEGGDTRYHSMENIISHLKDNYKTRNDTVLIHEAARPLISQNIILDHIEALKHHDATNTLFPAVDTMMISDDGEFIDSIPDKSKMYAGQTPQGYKLDQIINIIDNELTENDIQNEVDFCSIYLRKKRKVKIITGDEHLFKVTYEKDLALFRIALAEFKNRKLS